MWKQRLTRTFLGFAGLLAGTGSVTRAVPCLQPCSAPSSTPTHVCATFTYPNPCEGGGSPSVYYQGNNYTYSQTCANGTRISCSQDSNPTQCCDTKNFPACPKGSCS